MHQYHLTVSHIGPNILNMQSCWRALIRLRACAVVLLGSWCIACAGMAAQPQPATGTQPQFLGDEAPWCWPAEGARLRWTPSGPALDQVMDEWTAVGHRATYRCGPLDPDTGTVPLEINTEHVRLLGHIAASSLMEVTARERSLIAGTGSVRFAPGLRVRRSEYGTRAVIDDGAMEVYVPLDSVPVARTFTPVDAFEDPPAPDDLFVRGLTILDAPEGAVIAMLPDSPLGATFPYRVRRLGEEQGNMVRVRVTGVYFEIQGWVPTDRLYPRGGSVISGFGDSAQHATFSAGAPLFDRKDGMIIGRVVEGTEFGVQREDDGWCRIEWYWHLPNIPLWVRC